MLRLLIAALFVTILAPAQATEAGWALLRNGGHVVLLRHAMTTGTVEPPRFDLEKCNTQLNLSDRGRQQARKIGALFAARAAPTEDVLSSRYCRALETARLAFGDRNVEPWDALDEKPAQGFEAADAAVMERIRAFSGSDNLVFVTHLENIQRLTGSNAREGEALIVSPQDQGLHVLGRIVFN
ncbi:histidine phosphatase family protein [Oryzicola mucosus]|uniref:Histidine phosphatase family protein n=1 Tax=Oryzicola mucosus TaxID=2767425 RepID=A0A8J6PJY0_9HYPH|nr:histidine phosphatase family protein [Oryzicola mucosus]MBD0416404.1 histidine phosphatase family protein [Oryzicola mucosus]